jgi:hypothetical protein
MLHSIVTGKTIFKLTFGVNMNRNDGVNYGKGVNCCSEAGEVHQF